MQAMTRKKRLLLIASLPLAIVVTLGVLAQLPPRPGVTRANFDRIEKGMTLAQVEEIFGKEGKSVLVPKSHGRFSGVAPGGGGFRSGSGDFGPGGGGFGPPVEVASHDDVILWHADDEISVLVDFVDNCVTIKARIDSNDAVLDKICRWLHLP